jgi:hypothetical protein
VFIDGKEVGRTPVTARDIGSGSHAVRVEREGFVAEERKVAVSASRPSTSLTFTLERERVTTRNVSAPASNRGGLVSIESRPPGAHVMLDGRAIGTTPMTLSDVTAGSHTVSLDLPGYRRWTTAVQILPGERNRVAASLER